MNRLLYVDVIKCMAIIFVIMCHIHGELNNGEIEINSPLWWHLYIILGRIGVPLFMMTTGVLVLGKKFDTKEDIICFYKRNLATIYVSGAIWFFIYYFTKVSQVMAHLHNLGTVAKY